MIGKQTAPVVCITSILRSYSRLKMSSETIGGLAPRVVHVDVAELKDERLF